MMQEIRDKAQGIVAWVIVALIAIAFCSWGVSGYLTDNSIPTVAEVNGKKISAQEVDEIYERWSQSMAAQKGFDRSQIDPKLVKQQIAMSLAKQQAVIDGLTKDGFVVSDNMLVASIQQDPHLQQDGHFSQERFKQFLTQINVDEGTYEQIRRDDLLISQAQQGIVLSSFSLPNEVQAIIKIRGQKRDFGYTLVPVTRFAAATTVSDAQVAEYFDKHKASFIAPEKVKLEYIELSIEDLVQKSQATEQQLLDYYKDNVAAFTEPELLHIRHIMVTDQAKSQELYKKLQQGANFVELAKTESQDKQSAANGGDLGWISKSDAFPDPVYALAKDNDYTQPVQSDYGWHIFQLVERKTPKAKDFDSVRKIVEARYKRDQAEKLFATAGEELANISFENPLSLSAASAKLHLPIQTTDYLTRQGGPGIAASKNVINAAFSDEVLEQKHNSDLVRISDDSYVVLRVADRQAQHQQTLDEVRPQIVALLEKESSHEKAKQLGEALLQDIKSGVSPAKAAANKKLSWQVVKAAERDSKQIEPGILQSVFVMQKPQAGKAATTQGFPLPNGDYVIIVLTAVSDGTVENAEDSNMQEHIGKQMATLQGQMEFAALQSALVAEAKIKYAEQN